MIWDVVKILKNKVKKKIETETFESKKAIFITTDGSIHENSRYNWCKISGLTCSMDDYVMISIHSDGYIKDDDGVIYPLNNVVSIKWELLCTKKKISRYKDRYKIWFSDDSLNKMKDYNE